MNLGPITPAILTACHFTILEMASAVKGLPVFVRNPAWARALDTSRRDRRLPLAGYRWSRLARRTISGLASS